MSKSTQKVPTRNALYRMQGAIAEALSDNIDEYHFIATGRSTRFESPEHVDRKRTVRAIDAEIRKVEQAVETYLSALKVVRSRMEAK